MPLEITLPILLTIFGLIISVAAFRKNSDKQIRDDATTQAAAMTSLSSTLSDVRSDVKDIKGDMKDHNLKIMDIKMKQVEHEQRIVALEKGGTKQ